MSIAKNVGAVLLGLVVGMAANMALVVLNTMVLYPMPPGTDMNDPAQFKAYLDGLPGGAFVLPFVAHLAQSFLGAWVAARLAASRPMAMAMLLGVLSLVAGILNAQSVPMPTWMNIEFPLYLVVAWGAGVLDARRRAKAATTA